RIMHMAYFREKMVFHLKVQTTKQPSQYFATGSKICRGLDLMNHPFFFHFGLVDRLKLGFFHHVSELKNRCQRHSANRTGDQKPNEGWKPTDTPNRDDHEKKEMQNFTGPENNFFFSRKMKFVRG